MAFVLTKDNNKYLYIDGKVLAYKGKIKIRDNIIGYLAIQDGNEIKVTKTPIIRVDESVLENDLSLVAVIKELGLLIFEGKDKYYGYEVKNEDPYFNLEYYFKNLYKQFNIIYGIPILREDINGIITLINLNERKAIDIANKYPYDPVLRAAINILKGKDDCTNIINLGKRIVNKQPEDLLVIAECYERIGNLSEALRIYSLFDDRKYKDLELKIIDSINKLIDKFDENKDIKSLEDASILLPTYDAPIIKLGYYYYSKHDYERAIQMFEKAIARSKSFHNMVTLAYLYLLTEQYSKALQVIQEAEKIKITGNLAYIKGLVYENMNSKTLAEREYIYACEEGIIDACMKVQPYKLHYYSFDSSFDPKAWKGYNLYGYKVIDVIGNGGSGYVLLVEKNGNKYAAKVIKREYNISTLIYEIAKMQELSKGSRYLTKIYGSFVDENYTDYFSSPPLIIMEYMEGGDLKNIITNEEYSSLRYSEKWSLLVALIFYKIGQAIYYLHTQGYIHADVKPSNILFSVKLPKYIDEAIESISNDKIIVKLSDLGSSVKKGDIVLHYTPYYAHPLQRFGNKAEEYMDIYSLAVSMYATLTNNFPYPEWLEEEIEEAVTNFSKRTEVLKDFERVEPRLDRIPTELKSVIYKGLKTNYVSMRELLVELERVINELSASQNINLSSAEYISKNGLVEAQI